MPIEIRELVIRAVVEPVRSEVSESESGADTNRAQLIQDCVVEVMKVLRREEER